jgi:multidrug efflux pump
MMASKLLRHEKNPSNFYLKGEEVLNNLTNFYRKLLTAALDKTKIVVAVAMLTIVGLGALYKILPSELAPVEDRGFIIGFSIAPEGYSTDYVDRYSKQIENIYSGIPEKDRYFMITGFPSSTNSISFLKVADWEDRTRSTQDIANSIMGPMFAGVPGTMSFPMLPPSLGQSIISRPIEVVIQTTQGYEQLNTFTQVLMGKIYAAGLFTQPDVDLKLNKPQLDISVDRNKAADLGVAVSELGTTLETMMAGREVTRYKKGTEQYDVILQVEEENRANPEDISQIYVRGNGGSMIPLSNIVTVTESIAPKELNHFNKLKSAIVQAGLAPGVDVETGLAFIENEIQKLSAEMNIPVMIDYSGQTREFKESGAGLIQTFILALLFIYLVLAAQFESFKSPFIIMLSVPPALLGAVIALWLSGGTANVYSQIGLLTLVGLITKHGILIVEFADQLQEQGKQKLEAVIESASMRLRPILMTTAAMVLGAIPLALATGAGAESREQIGWVIVGGMSIGTLLTLFIVPAFYILLAAQHKPEEHKSEDQGVSNL